MSSVGLAKEKEFVQVACATVRFAGDSGDGMQLAGSQFADIASMTGTVVCTLPDFPSEIRAPAGSLAGVSGFQLSFADHEVRTPGDSPYVLIAMNPAALKVNLPDLQPGGIIIVNEDEFTPANLAKAGYAANPLTSGELRRTACIPVAMTRLNEEAVKPLQLARKDAARCKNFFALGLTLWLYDRPLQPMLEWLMKKFRKNPTVMAANGASLAGGLQLRRYGRIVSRSAHGRHGAAAQGTVSPRDGQRSGGAGTGRGRPSRRPDAGLCQLSDHAGQRNSARTVEIQGVRRPHASDRRRDRRLRRGDRRVVRRRDRRRRAPAGRASR